MNIEKHFSALEKFYTGKRILVTGGAQGLGRRLIHYLVKIPCEVIIWDVNEKALANALEEFKMIAKEPSKITGDICDISDFKRVELLAKKVLSSGTIDILINNAGIVVGKDFVSLSKEEIEKTFSVNALGMFWVTKSFLPHMLEKKQGSVVNIASAAGIIGVAKMTDYCASKFAAFGFTEALRMECKKFKWNIATTLVCPYFLNNQLFSGARTRFSFLLPILDEDYVASKILIGVAKKKEMILMPLMVYTTWLCRLLPIKAFDFVAEILGINRSLDHFHK